MSEAMIKLRLVTRSRVTGCAGMMEDGETVKIRIKAPPVDGKANRALLKWLREIWQLPASSLRISAGARSRTKTVAIRGMNAKQALEILLKS